MKRNKFLSVIIMGVLLSIIFTTQSLAASFALDIYCDGKTIRMESEQTQMGIDVSNLLPGQTDTSYLTVANKGTKDIELYISASIAENEDNLLDIIEFSIKDSSGDLMFSGDYNQFKRVELALANGKEQTYTLITKLPKEAGNEYQDKRISIKFDFEARGEKDSTAEPEKPKPDEPEEIVTTEIVKPQTGQERIIYIVLAVLLIILVAILIKINYDKKRLKKND